jgi:hypothetical protein
MEDQGVYQETYFLNENDLLRITPMKSWIERKQSVASTAMFEVKGYRSGISFSFKGSFKNVIPSAPAGERVRLRRKSRNPVPLLTGLKSLDSRLRGNDELRIIRGTLKI